METFTPRQKSELQAWMNIKRKERDSVVLVASGTLNGSRKAQADALLLLLPLLSLCFCGKSNMAGQWVSRNK